MKKSKLSSELVPMKKLSKDEMKSVLGGGVEVPDEGENGIFGCTLYKVGEECNEGIQCCSTNCATDSSSPTVKKCQVH